MALFIPDRGDDNLIRKIPDFNHILSWAVFLFWSGIFAIFYYSGDYTDFLNPELGWLVFMAFFLNLVFFFSIFFAPVDKEEHCHEECSHSHHYGRESVGIFKLLILLAPILFIAGFESGQLGEYAFKKRAVDLGRIDNHASAFSQNKKVAGDVDYGDLLVASVAARLPVSVTLLDIHADFEKLLGNKILTKGIYIADSPGIPEGTFVVFRFIMVCCVADAQPLAVLVKGTPPRNLKSEDWIDIEGVLEKIEIQGNPAAVIKAAKIVVAPAPLNPYLSPRIR